MSLEKQLESKLQYIIINKILKVGKDIIV